MSFMTCLKEQKKNNGFIKILNKKRGKRFNESYFKKD